MPKLNHFIEAVADDAGKIGLKYVIRVIRAGQSGNNNFYPDRVLRESVALFDKARVFSKSDAEHIKGQGKSFAQLIGQLTEPRFIEGQGQDNGEIQATLTLFASAGEVVAKLKEAYDNNMTDLFGFSIDADGLTQMRGKLREATKLVKVHSVDLIIEPGAGGQLMNLVEAVAPDLTQQDTTMPLLEIMLAAIKVANKGNLPTGLDITNNEAVLAAYADALKKGMNRYCEAHESTALLAESKLPAPVVDKLKAQFEKTDDLTLVAVREAIDTEKGVLAKLTESGHVKGLGDTHIEMGKDRSEKVTAMFDDFFNPTKRAMSFRECYVEMTGDNGVTGLMQNCDQRRLREALGGDEMSFREAISAATFGNVLGNSITRAMVRDYQSMESYNDWQDLVDVVPVNNFRTQERTRMGGYGNLPAVAENAAYVALTSPSDEKSTYAVTKRGGKETISIETIANDDVGAIRKIPQRLAVAAKRTLYEFILDFIRTNPTVYDSVALFHATHANLGTAALSAAAFSAARLAVKQQVEAGSSKKLGLLLKHLYVPAELEETAFDLFVRNTNLDESFVQSRKPKVHVVDYWTDVNNWFATADKMETPLIELGFYNGNEEPELFVQDLPTQGSLFSNDQIVYKIRHIYGGAIIDYRGFYGAIVA